MRKIRLAALPASCWVSAKYLLLAAALLLGAAPGWAEHYSFATFSFPPYEFEQDGAPRGIAVDLVAEAMHRLGYGLEVRIYPWARALDEARRGKVSAIFTAYRTGERERYLDYSHEVLVPQTVALFARKGRAVDYRGDLLGLAEFTIGAVNSMSYGSRFDAAVADGVLRHIELANDSELNMRRLLAGRVDLLVSNVAVARYLLAQDERGDQVQEIDPPLEQVPSYLCFTKAVDLSGLRDAIDRTLVAMRDDGTTARIFAAYTGRRPTAEEAPSEQAPSE
jgi:polar amino acid transport system substrate-binding protein